MELKKCSLAVKSVRFQNRKSIKMKDKLENELFAWKINRWGTTLRNKTACYKREIYRLLL